MSQFVNQFPSASWGWVRLLTEGMELLFAV